MEARQQAWQQRGTHHLMQRKQQQQQWQLACQLEASSAYLESHRQMQQCRQSSRSRSPQQARRAAHSLRTPKLAARSTAQVHSRHSAMVVMAMLHKRWRSCMEPCCPNYHQKSRRQRNRGQDR